MLTASEVAYVLKQQQESEGVMVATDPQKGAAEQVGCPIIEGADYVYIAPIPAGCAGHKYRLHRQVVDVPSYQQKVLVEALSGKDEGLLFTCTLDNFARRYRLASIANGN